ncbi:uncharacterized protein LOC110916829 isoform X2 [Helianthus annuus]|uniref:Uncharacterized protein n=1 Tax=Helianthus annuus TaxID=4232 RepID=A0A251RV13_HELAN|nr:uncharacterized protein LOC110916829 isoform X2 [Helianthus annuus]
MQKMCSIEGLRMTFQPQPQVSIGMGVNNELYTQAAEAAFQNLKAKIGQFSQKRQLSSRCRYGWNFLYYWSHNGIKDWLDGIDKKSCYNAGLGGYSWYFYYGHILLWLQIV